MMITAEEEIRSSCEIRLTSEQKKKEKRKELFEICGSKIILLVLLSILVFDHLYDSKNLSGLF